LIYINHHLGGKLLFVPTDALPGVGQQFHRLADQLIDFIKHDRDFHEYLQHQSESPTAVAQYLQQGFYKADFFPYLQAQTQQDQALAAPLMQVWQGLCMLIPQFAQLLIRNQGRLSAHQAIQKTFVDIPRRLSHDFTLPDGTLQKVSGEVDCIIFDPDRQRLCVIEFKTYAPVDPTAQLAQAAIYSNLLHQHQQAPIDVAIYCVLPIFQAFHYRWEDLETSIHQVIPHKLQQMRQWLDWQAPQPDPPPATTQRHYLCPICPERIHCQTLFESEAETNTAPPIHEAEGNKTEPTKIPTKIPTSSMEGLGSNDSTHQMGLELVEMLRSFKIDTTFQGSVRGPAFTRIKIKPELGVKVASLLKLGSDLQVQLGLEVPPLIAAQAGFVSFDLPRPDRQTAHFSDYIRPIAQPISAPIKIAIGVDLDGQLIEADLSDPNTCHFLVGGTTGSGKSEFLRSLLLSLLVRHRPETLQIALVDPKRVTFPEFETMPWLMAPVVKQSEDAIDLMEQLSLEMENRYQRFEKAACNDLHTYNQQIETHQALPRIVCIFDEYADFMAEKETANALEQSIKRLGAMARAAGIHLIIATQRPEAKVVTPLIRSNLPGRVALRTATAADSKIILGDDETMAAALLGKGDLLYKAGAIPQRLQSLFAKEIKF
jgi:DNA segregation ATPase FtsK/SpoIIIE, S-DNA-T family